MGERDGLTVILLTPFVLAIALILIAIWNFI